LDGVSEKNQAQLSEIRKKEEQDLWISQIVLTKVSLFNSKVLEDFNEESFVRKGYNLNEQIKPTVMTQCENYLGSIQIIVDLQDWYPEIKVCRF